MRVDISYDTRNENDAKKDSTVAFKSSRKGDKNSYDRDLGICDIGDAGKVRTSGGSRV